MTPMTGYGKEILLTVLFTIILLFLYWWISEDHAYYYFRKSMNGTIERKWFGARNSSSSSPQNTKIYPFQINVHNDEIQGLKSRLKLDMERFSDPITDDFVYGFNTNVLRQICDYWSHQFDWKKQEEFLNTHFPHFKTNIDGIDLHFIHSKAKDENSKKKVVLLLHGWPGSFVEFIKVIPKFNDGGYDVVVPSIPGFGFSSPPLVPGFNAAQASLLFSELMSRLHYETFYVQGGDWGSAIGIALSVLFPKKVEGLHLNLVGLRTPGALLKTILAYFFPSLILTHTSQSWMIIRTVDGFFNLLKEMGYLYIQSTKPETIGVALNASPAGLAAWILEKWGTATNKNAPSSKDGKLTEKFTLDELLTDVSIYWFTRSASSSARFYYENIGSSESNYIINSVVKDVPTGVAVFPNEIAFSPQGICENKFKNLVHYSVFSVGGHFAAMEEPELFAKDVITFMDSVSQN